MCQESPTHLVYSTSCKVNRKQIDNKIFIWLSTYSLHLIIYIHYLIEHKNYPATLLANEVPLQVGEKKVRADSVLYDQHLRPRMIIEYKAPSVPITQKVFDQIFVYNILLHVDYLIVSNWLETYICRMDYDNQKYLFLEDIPNYQNIWHTEVLSIYKFPIIPHKKTSIRGLL